MYAIWSRSTAADATGLAGSDRCSSSSSVGSDRPPPSISSTSGDVPNRLMDSGGDRPFEERAELAGQGPAVFCDEEYAYLKKILPLDAPADPPVSRPPCE